jgi:ankyrin repeat protein
MAAIPINISQRHILNQCIRYMEIQHTTYPKKYKKKDIESLKNMISGRCSGFASLWMYRKFNNDIDRFYSTLNVLSKWDGTEESLRAGKDKRFPEGYLADVFQQTINDFNWFFQENLRINLPNKSNYNSFVDIVNIVKPASDPSLAKIFTMGFIFKREELIETLGVLFREKKMISLTSFAHAVSAMQVNGKYCLYDPNSPTGEQSFGTIEAFAKQLEEDLYTQCGNPLTIHNPMMSMEIHIYDNATPQGESEYGFTSGDLVTRFIQEKNDINRIHVAYFPSAAGGGTKVIYTPLMAAARTGDLDSVQVLIQMEGININSKNNQGTDALMLAASFGHAKIVKLLSNEMNVNCQDSKGNTALMRAIKEGHIDVVKTLLKRKIDFALKDNEGQSPLTMTISQGQPEMAAALITAGVDPNELLPDGNVLKLAIVRNQNEIVKILLKAKANIHLKYKENKTAILISIDSNNIEAAQLLIEAGANANEVAENGFSVLMLAVSDNELGLLKTLIQHKADVNFKNYLGTTALMIGLRYGRTEAIQLLISAGADIEPHDLYASIIPRILNNHSLNCTAILSLLGTKINNRDSQGRTALMLAASNDKEKIVDALIKAKADISLKDNSKNTALICAVKNNFTTIVKRLCEAGANPNEIMTGWSPLLWAVRSENIEMVITLLNAKADPYVKHHPSGLSVLRQALSKKDAEMVKVLCQVTVPLDEIEFDGNTPLICAVLKNDHDSLNILLKYGAKTETLNNANETALMFASSKGNVRLVQTLLNQGANVHFRNNLRRSALLCALESGQIEIVPVLIEKGATLEPFELTIALSRYSSNTRMREVLMSLQKDQPLLLTSDSSLPLLSMHLSTEIDRVKALETERKKAAEQSRDINAGSREEEDGFQGKIIKDQPLIDSQAPRPNS